MGMMPLTRGSTEAAFQQRRPRLLVPIRTKEWIFRYSPSVSMAFRVAFVIGSSKRPGASAPLASLKPAQEAESMPSSTKGLENT
eukprot:Skav214895  [mRNA]  locus=scaffold1561:82137:82866:+ [translate_table: standard]